ncbi:MAG TPA: YbaB/EbfC family nucleoid-associated protein, partial [Xanthomonadaceae bacterium]|nr:YbaB/EbfC family nucleoid-associated protein [Xanthomonadaceae bacterium]
MRGNIAQLMQQAQRVQDNLKRVQDELATLEVGGQSGGGMVAVTITGKFECRRVRIDPSVLDDADMLEDLIAAAFNDAVANANAEAAR